MVDSNPLVGTSSMGDNGGVVGGTFLEGSGLVGSVRIESSLFAF